MRSAGFVAPTSASTGGMSISSTATSPNTSARSTLLPPSAVTPRSGTSSLRDSRSAVASAVADSAEPSTPTTMACGNRGDSGVGRAMSTEHLAACRTSPATPPSNNSLMRRRPCDPSAIAVAPNRSASVRMAVAQKPLTVRVFARPSRSSSAVASASSAAPERCSAYSDSGGPSASTSAMRTTDNASIAASGSASVAICLQASNAASDPSTPMRTRLRTKPVGVFTVCSFASREDGSSEPPLPWSAKVSPPGSGRALRAEAVLTERLQRDTPLRSPEA